MRYILLVLLFTLQLPLHGQEVDGASQQKFEQLKLERLGRIQSEILDLNQKISNLQSKIKNANELIGKIRYENQLKTVIGERDRKQLEFVETATNVSIAPASHGKDTSKEDFSEQLKDVFGPLLQGIRQASERPRQIQAYNDRVSELSDRYDNAMIALERLKEWEVSDKTEEERELGRSIETSIKITSDLAEEARIEKEDIEYRLHKLKQEKGSFFSEISGMILGFFKTKGKNLALALLTFLFFYWGFKKIRPRFVNLMMFRLNRGDAEEKLHWAARPIKILYSVFTLILSLFLALIVLYILNDWVLVTFVILLVVALLWSSKEYFPAYFEQSKMILNLGTVREGERIIFNSIAWEVKSLGYYCRLENPALAGGSLRVSTKLLLSHYSRPINLNEPWFPTHKDDWVELSDGLFGKVAFQTPEQIAVRKLGGELKYFKTEDFLSANPVNLSNGFGIEFYFGVDYSHQKILFSELIPNFKNEILRGLKEEFPADEEEFKELSIEFQSAGPSSLDLRFFMKCGGKLASRKLALKRKVNSMFVEVCNKYDYIITLFHLTNLRYICRNE